MNKIPGMSIRRKLTWTMMGISLAGVLLTVMAITAYLIYDMGISKAQELSVTATLTGDRNSAALVFADGERVQHNLEIFRLNPSILAACIYDAKGALFMAYKAENAPNIADCPPQATQTKALPGVLTAYEKIRAAGETVGGVFLVADTREIDAYVSKILQISATVACLVLGMTLLLTMYFQRTISGPILELAATAQSITANRDYSIEAKAAYNDETGVLARAFNAMLSEVRKRDRELISANETLEHKVLQRTRQLEDAKLKAEMASEAKSEFLRNMSHEFRTPLHALISFSAYGIREYETAPPAKLRQYFDVIQKGAERLSRLVNEVLDLAKLEHGDYHFLLARGDIRELCGRAAEMVQPLLQEKNITLRFEDDGTPAIAMCDHDKMVQVITNLLGNAIKFTPSGKAITLAAGTAMREGHEQVIVAVSDDGIGIPPGEEETIFESFRQSSRTNTGAGGTGLGLSICRNILKAHDGRIWAENNVNGGARVAFALPAACDDNANPRTEHLQSTEVRHESAA